MQSLDLQIRRLCRISLRPGTLVELRTRLAAEGVAFAVRSRDTPALYDWLMRALSYQGVSDAIAWRYMNEHGAVAFSDVGEALNDCSSCPRLTSYWHFHDCRFAKAANTCSEPAHRDACPLPSHDLRNGRLNQTTYALFLFLRDICDGDLVGWIDAQLAAADRTGAADREGKMRQGLLEPLGCIHGVSNKVLSMALADLLLGGDPDRERWIATGASMVAVDTLVHNWLHRTGSLRRLGAEHPYGPSCYASGGCANIIEEAAGSIDAREFCPDGPAVFPRLIQKAIWLFCAEGGLNVCNGNRIGHRRRCALQECMLFDRCERLPLQPEAAALR